MDRQIVYPAAIPLDTDILSIQRNTMIALGYLAQATLGTSTVVDGLALSPTAPASLQTVVSPGLILTNTVIDQTAFGSLNADTTDPLVKMGVNIASTTMSALVPPGTAGQSQVFLLQAQFQEPDGTPVVLPYYNAANPAQPYSGPNNSGTSQNTVRKQTVALEWKAGVPATTGSQVAPSADAGWTPLWTVTLANGDTTITSGKIALASGAPFIQWKVPQLSPGFSNQWVKASAGTYSFTVPAWVTKIEVTTIGGGGGGSGSDGADCAPCGGGGGTVIDMVTVAPGETLTVVVGAGGAAGTQGAVASHTGSDGGTSSLSRGGTTLVAASGGGGAGTTIAFAGGNAGIGTTGGSNALLVRGGYGSNGSGPNTNTIATAPGAAGMGGSSSLGGGGRCGGPVGASGGLGAGGGGNIAGTGNPSGGAGGAGGDGAVIIRY